MPATKDIAEAARLVRAKHSFLVLPHTNPDGDAIGSCLALTLALQRMGKTAVFCTQDGVPEMLAFLPGTRGAVRKVEDLSVFDAIFVLDCGDFHRVGRIHDRIADHPSIVNLDHHASNPFFGRVNVVDEAASSSSELVHRLLLKLGYRFDPDVATCVYTGIYSDTSRFYNSNSTPDAYRICGEMVAAGADPVSVARNLFIAQPREKVALFSAVLPTLRLEKDGRIAGMICALDVSQRLKATSELFEGFVDYPLSINGVEASYLLREVMTGEEGLRVKGSLRTTERVDAAAVSGFFGGGGHRRAAGFTAAGPLEDVRKRLIEQLKKQLKH
ncbi:DHH family phosphoesterase [bacterium]|nr:DHH family phosphoesterase [bacterium]